MQCRVMQAHQFAVGRLKSKIGDMCGDFRAIPLGIASFHERAAGRCVNTDQRTSANLAEIPIEFLRKGVTP